MRRRPRRTQRASAPSSARSTSTSRHRSGSTRPVPYFINLSSPLTGRDNLREAEADLIQLTKSIPGLTVAAAAPGSLPAGPASVDATRISFVGLSLGSIVGATHAQYAAGTRTVALSVPGGVLTQLLNDSAAFGPSIKAGVNAQGLAPGSYLYNLYFRDFQAVIDGGDPINHIKDTQNAHPTLLFKVLNDGVVPNNSTDRLITAGGLTKLTTPGNNAVGAGTGAWSFFKVGSHGTLFDPTTSLSATMEMQAQAISFSASAPAPGGPYVAVGLVDTDVLDLRLIPACDSWADEGRERSRPSFLHPLQSGPRAPPAPSRIRRPSMGLFNFRSKKAGEPAPDEAVGEGKPGFVARLRARLNRGNSWLTYDLANLLPGGTIDDAVLDELETRLIAADVGIETTEKILGAPARARGAQGTRRPRRAARRAARRRCWRSSPRWRSRSSSTRRAKPFVILVVGVNGSGKTTTIGKLAHLLSRRRPQDRARGGRHVPCRGDRAVADLGRAQRRARDRAGGRRRSRGGGRSTPCSPRRRAARTC